MRLPLLEDKQEFDGIAVKAGDLPLDDCNSKQQCWSRGWWTAASGVQAIVGWQRTERVRRGGARRQRRGNGSGSIRSISGERFW